MMISVQEDVQGKEPREEKGRKNNKLKDSRKGEREREHCEGKSER